MMMSETMKDVALEAIGLLEDALATIDFEYGHIGDEQEREHADMVAGLRRRAHGAGEHDQRGTCHMSREIIEHQPTIDALGTVSLECSRCGRQFYLSDVCVYPDRPSFCPNCGARTITICA